MENKEIDKLIKLHTLLVRTAITPSFKLPKGGATVRTFQKAVGLLKMRFGEPSDERLVDYSVDMAFRAWKSGKATIAQIFSEAWFKRYLEAPKGLRFYEDEWLKEHDLDRQTLVDLIKDDGQHPHSKFLFVPSEEPTKRRHLNKRVGYAICQISTLGWSPESDSCKICRFIRDCKKETLRKYPELYRLRKKYHGQSINTGSAD